MITAASDRFDVAFIRVSTGVQDDGGQAAHVKSMLRNREVEIAPENWFSCTVPRAGVAANEEFQRLIKLVEEGKVGTVYIEGQKRFGTGNNSELFNLIEFFRKHGTRLFDLRERLDLTGDDDTTELRLLLGGQNSKRERKDISLQSLRTRVNNFKTRGTWPTGCQPFGYGKECRSPEGKLLWVWEPSSRTRGRAFHPDCNGKLSAGLADEKIPRKGKLDSIVLVPCRNKESVNAIKTIFDLYTRAGFSRRKISAQLNATGAKCYGNNFTHSLITQILSNPAYVGDTHFGKTHPGTLHSFDEGGNIVPTKRLATSQKPPSGFTARLVKEGTHEALISRKTWERAQERLKDEQERTNYSPRNSAYYLKSLLVCGHCGKNMTGRTEIHPTTKGKTTVYVCSSYVTGKSNGAKATCGYQRIRHEDAEKMLMDKLGELDLDMDALPSKRARANMTRQLSQLDEEHEAAFDDIEESIQDGIDALLDYLGDSYDRKTILHLRKMVDRFYWGFKPREHHLKLLPFDFKTFRKAIDAAEVAEVKRAVKKVAEFREEHKAITLSWAKANDLQKSVLHPELARLEREIEIWTPRTQPLAQRVKAYFASNKARFADRRKLRADLPTLENREKGEAFRRLFKQVTLFWDRKHCPPSAKPTRPRRTTREGRYSYTLKRDQIKWALTDSSLACSY